MRVKKPFRCHATQGSLFRYVPPTSQWYQCRNEAKHFLRDCSIRKENLKPAPLVFHKWGRLGNRCFCNIGVLVCRCAMFWVLPSYFRIFKILLPSFIGNASKIAASLSDNLFSIIPFV